MHDLSDYLNTSQRLSLETSKTRIVSTETFLEKYFTEPKDQEMKEQERAKEQLVYELKSFANHYSEESTETKLNSKQLNKLARKTLVTLLEQCLDEHPLSLGFARHILRRATQLRTNILLPTVTENLETLVPVMRDVVKYLNVVIKSSNAGKYSLLIEQFLTEGTYAELPFVRMWGLEIILGNPSLLDFNKALHLSESFRGDLGVRSLAQIAQVYNQPDWVREHKETWRLNSEWDQRAIIMSAKILPKDERRHWLGQVSGVTNGVERAVAQYASL